MIMENGQYEALVNNINILITLREQFLNIGKDILNRERSFVIRKRQGKKRIGVFTQ